jgi:hypothetical protein
MIRSEFVKYDADYEAKHELYGEKLVELAKLIASAQTDSKSLPCTQQLFLEAKWLYHYTAHWKRLDDQFERVKASLGQKDQDFASEQRPTDGFWGICLTAHFMRISVTLDALEDLTRRGQQPRYSIRSAGVLDTDKKLLTSLQDLLVSDVARTGVDNRGELSSLITSISQAAFKPHLRQIITEALQLPDSVSVDYLAKIFEFFLSGAQNTVTGYWGAWYIVDGNIVKTDDLSMTYHIVSYSKGDVEHWPQILKTTRAIQNEPYPYGWLHNGRYNNHNLYDVARIYKYGWPHMTEAERREASEQIQFMLDWSLANTLESNGSFKSDPTFSDSIADDYYFGVSLFDVTGYWSPPRRFWSQAPTANGAAEMCCRLRRQLGQLKLSGWAASGAEEKLARNCSVCEQR